MPTPILRSLSGLRRLVSLPLLLTGLLPCLIFSLPQPLTGSDESNGVAFDRLASIGWSLPAPAAPRLPGEFERQQAVLLAWDRESGSIRQTQIDTIRAIRERLPVLILVTGPAQEREVRGALQGSGVPQVDISFLHAPFDTIWTRDYGPTVVSCPDGSISLIDAAYDRDTRPNDDDVPKVVAAEWGLVARETGLRLEGGNLISNGAGVLVTTRKVLEDNPQETEQRIVQSLKQIYGAETVVLLEPLDGEDTGHVDMFATFPRSDTVIVGTYDASYDEANAAILDRNAARLAQVRLASGPLRVVRIPMPETAQFGWPTFTNVLYANGVLVVPDYPGVDDACREAAYKTYRQVLPTWSIVAVDCNQAIALGGAIHCMTMNLARLPEKPGGSRALARIWRTSDTPVLRRAAATPVRKSVSFGRVRVWRTSPEAAAAAVSEPGHAGGPATHK